MSSTAIQKPDPTVVQQGYVDCRQVCRSQFGEYLWLFSNLTRDQQRDLYPIFAYLHHCLRLLRFTGHRNKPSVEWSEWRDEVRRAMAGKSDHSQLCAVIDVFDRHSVSKQFLFDILDGIDSYIRFGKFETFEELVNFASRIGGSTVLACLPIIDIEKEGYEEVAMHCGEAILLTHILGRVGVDARDNRVLLARQDIERAQCDLEQIGSSGHDKPFATLVRSVASRIELEFFEASPLIDFLSFDGRRIMKSVFAVHWELLNKCKHDPFLLIDEANRLTKAERLRLRLKHILGTEGKGVPILIAADPGGH